ncbi:hypothetical protein [Pontibacter rugosus]|uniref:Uncharacterized protein n=1 Tax=Pontibacter rugosus TaxID=1745966 RepID=A0ABW3SQ11_9BACT
MNRHDRVYYEYGPYDGYSRNDEHYHSARNLTNEFERDFQRERGRWNEGRNQVRHSYHEGDMGDTYERYSREDGGYENYSASRQNNRDRNRYEGGNYNSDHNRNQDFWSDAPANQNRYGNSQNFRDNRQGALIPNRYNSNEYSRNRNQQTYHPGTGTDDIRPQSNSHHPGSASGSNAGDIWGNPNRRRYQVDRYY